MQPDATTTAEARRELRGAIRDNVRARLISIPGRVIRDAEPFLCETCDLSLSGVRLLTATPLEVGMVLELAIFKEGVPNEYLHVGEVRWTAQDELRHAFQNGIQFVFSSASSRHVWERYVQLVLSTQVDLPEDEQHRQTA